MYYAIINTNEKFKGYQYKDGLNELNEEFAESGLYFTNIDHILELFESGIYMREITLPDNDVDFKMILVGENKWRANKIILGKRYDLGKCCDMGIFNEQMHKY